MTTKPQAAADAAIRASGITSESPMRLRMEQFVRKQQQEITSALQSFCGSPTATFRRDDWTRSEGGGGTTMVLQDTPVFEKAGLGVSVVYGTLPKPAIIRMAADHKSLLGEDIDQLDFFACGISMVVHPANPMAPTVHLNYRYFETTKPDGRGTWWFGGGSDLTPAYLFEDDAVHFHHVIKDACDKTDPAYYPRFKKWCDDYFYNKHRLEARGIGGIFYDDLGAHEGSPEKLFCLAQNCLTAFLPQYLPIISRRKDMPYTEKQKEWQQVRRGRYVEFNLVHDRGTSFGLNTPGPRVESILMSMPLTARWEYMYPVEEGSEEAKLEGVLKNPRDWLGIEGQTIN